MTLRSRRSLLALAIAASLGVAGCSNDDGGGGEDTAPATDAASVPGTDGAPATSLSLLGVVPAPGLTEELAQAQQAAWTLAVDDVNAAGGVLGGMFEVLTAREDEASSPGELPPAAAGADGVLGPVSSDAAVALLPTLESDGLVACSASATSPTLAAQDPAGVLFRTSLPDQYTVNEVAKVLVARRDEAGVDAPYAVQVVARDDSYGTSVAQGLTAALEAQGIDAAITTYPATSVILSEPAAEVAASGAQAVVAVSLEEAPILIRDLIRAGVGADTIVGLDGAFTPRLVEQIGVDPAELDGLSVVANTGGFDFLKRMVDSGATQVLYGPQMYDCAISIALAAEAAGSSDPAEWAPLMAAVTAGGVTCSTFADCLGKLAAGEDIDYDGPSGRIAFDGAGGVSSARWTLAELQGGEFEAVENLEVDLADAAGLAALESAVFTAALQADLTTLGFYDGPIDGIYDDEVMAAVAALQTSLGLPATGIYDEATDAALAEAMGTRTSALRTATTELQLALTTLGFYSGPIDGRYTQATIDAVKALQAEVGAPTTGVIDVATLVAVYERGLAVGSESVPSTTVPPTAPGTTAPPAPTTTAAPVPGDPITTVLASNAQFSTFAELVQLAGLSNLLAAPGQLSVFAPTNDAFALLPPDTLDALRSDPEALGDLVRAHIGAGAYSSGSLPSQIPSLQAGTLTVTNDGGTIRVNGAAVVVADLAASNGFVHGIDQVLVTS
jgi:branched-chain amino acid transport system substrate-binding protein